MVNRKGDSDYTLVKKLIGRALSASSSQQLPPTGTLRVAENVVIAPSGAAVAANRSAPSSITADTVAPNSAVQGIDGSSYKGQTMANKLTAKGGLYLVTNQASNAVELRHNPVNSPVELLMSVW